MQLTQARNARWSASSPGTPRIGGALQVECLGLTKQIRSVGLLTTMADSSIQVVVRVRPMNARELALLAPVEMPQPFHGDGGLAASPSKVVRTNYIRNIVAPVDEHMLVFDPADGPRAPRATQLQYHGNSRRARDVRYAFDRVFPESTRQRDVYEATVEPMFAGLLSGYNASVFAYGVRTFSCADAGDGLRQDAHD